MQSSHSIRIRRLWSLPSAARLRKRESMSSSTTCGASPQSLCSRLSRKKDCETPVLGVDSFRLAKVQERRFRCQRPLCAALGSNFLAAALAARLSIKSDRLLQNFSRWQQRSPSNSIPKPLFYGRLKRSGTMRKKARGWYFSLNDGSTPTLCY